ncbi:hypothetical protein [Pseudolactococcus laudensis]|uniref:hypothetical protein n=1 Tax=Pseudolactococcus laudensis TaxID=1494461 RepID=UPI002FC5D380
MTLRLKPADLLFVKTIPNDGDEFAALFLSLPVLIAMLPLQPVKRPSSMQRLNMVS